jgi:hypothetical protein
MTVRYLGLLAAGLSCLASPLQAADKPPTLTPDDIKTTFGTGLPFSAATPGGQIVMMTLKPDGTAQAAPKGKKKVNKGKWRLSDTGYCTKWGKSAEHCYTVQKNGAGYDVKNPAGVVVAHWTI